MERILGFSEIYRQHAEAVFRLAWMLSGDRHEAEDLTSEAFARALAGAGRIEQPTVRGYLYAIVRNLANSRRRRPALERPADDEELHQVAEPDPGPEQRAELRQCLMQAHAGLESMREPDRQVLLLCGVHGLSNLEIADALGLDPNHVRVRLHRARRHLASLMNNQGANHELA